MKNDKLLWEGKVKATIQPERQERYRDKNLHGRFYKAPYEVRDEKMWEWLTKSGIKKETDCLVMAAQVLAIRTKYIRKVIDKEDTDPKCRLCGERDETIVHILADCKMLAQCQYKNWRHDKVALVLHWEICKKYGLPASEKWYDHRIETVMENEEVTVMWDMKIHTDKEIEHCRPDIFIRCNKSRKCYIVDVACSFDTRVQDKEREKVEKYQDLNGN